MHDVFDEGGSKLGSIPLSEKMLKLLEAEGTVTVQYHTPQLLLQVIGPRSGSFELNKKAGRIQARGNHVAALKHFIDLQADVKRARES